MRNRYSHWSKNQEGVCKFCGQKIVWMRYQNGAPYPTDIILTPSGDEAVITGSGNHYNFKPRHDCRGAARKQLPEYQAQLEKLETQRRVDESHKAEFTTALACDQTNVPNFLLVYMNSELERIAEREKTYEADKAAIQNMITYYEKRLQ